jgi:hypothetical protein
MLFRNVTFDDADFERLDKTNALLVTYIGAAAATVGSLWQALSRLNELLAYAEDASQSGSGSRLRRGFSVPVALAAKTISFLAEAKGDKSTASDAHLVYERAKKIRLRLDPQTHEVMGVVFTPVASACRDLLASSVVRRGGNQENVRLLRRQLTNKINKAKTLDRTEWPEPICRVATRSLEDLSALARSMGRRQVRSPSSLTL